MSKSLIFCLLFLATCFFAAGCMQMQLLPYLDQVLALKEFGDDKDAQHKYVKNINAQFDRLVIAVQSGEIRKYKTEQDVVKSFGPPVLSQTVESNGESLKRCLYRYAIQRTSPGKIYVYYDPQGNLVKYEQVA